MAYEDPLERREKRKTQFVRGERQRQAREWQLQGRAQVLAIPEPMGFDVHWKWYYDKQEKMMMAEEKLQIDAIPLGYPVLVQQRIKDAKIGKAPSGNTNFKYIISACVNDSWFSEWDGVADKDDIVIRVSGAEKTISHISLDKEGGTTAVTLVSSPVGDVPVFARYSYNYEDLAAIQAADNGKIITVEPDLTDVGAGNAFAVLVFTVPTIKTNTQIKGYIRMASNRTCSGTFQQYMYDFDGNSWDLLTSNEFYEKKGTTAVADTNFRIYTFHANDDKYVSDKNLLAICFIGYETGTDAWNAFLIDYAWAWLDRTSGWF